MGKNKEQLEKTTKFINEMAKEIQNLTIQIQLVRDALNELDKQIKMQQPIIINPSPLWPTNNPQWEPYTPTWITTTGINNNATKITGDAK